MNVRRIAEQECAALSKFRDDAMVDVIRREPIDARNNDAETLDHAAADVVPPELVVRSVFANDSDQPYMSVALQRKRCDKIRLVERNVKLVIDDRSARFCIGNVKHMGVSPARERASEHFAHFRMRAVATGDVRSFAGCFAAVGHLQPRDDTVAAIVEMDKLDGPLDFDAGLAQPIGQQSLVLILRKNEHVRKRADASAHRAEHNVRNLPALDPQIDGCKLEAALDDAGGKSDLPIELERPRMDDERA